MYSHLTKKEKRKRLELARKRALHWLIQQQTIAILKSTSKLQSTTTSTNRVPTQRDSYLNSQTTFHTPLELPAHSTETIQAIQQTLLDLQEQREAIDTTISVLQHRLDFLLKTKTPR